MCSIAISSRNTADTAGKTSTFASTASDLLAVSLKVDGENRCSGFDTQFHLGKELAGALSNQKTAETLLPGTGFNDKSHAREDSAEESPLPSLRMSELKDTWPVVVVAEAAAEVVEAVACLLNSPTSGSAPVVVAVADLEAPVVQVQAPAPSRSPHPAMKE